MIDASTLDAARHVGHQPRPGRRRSTAPCRHPTRSTIPTTRETVDARARVHGPRRPGTPIRDIAVDTVFIGQLHEQPHRGPARRGRRDRRAAPSPCQAGDGRAGQPRREGAGRGRGSATEVFRAAGADWREPGCSMCLAMNPDKLAPGERVGEHQQPQLRGSPGSRRPHASRQPGRRRGHRGRRPLRHPRETCRR